MKPVKCESCKKFYDADKYSSCPHCKSGNAETVFSSVSKATEEKQAVSVSQVNENKSGNFFSRLSIGKTAIQKSESESIGKVESSQIDIDAETKTSENENASEVQVNIVSGMKNTYSDTPKAAKQTEGVVQNAEPAAMSISEAVKNANSVQNTADQKTVAFYNFSNDIEPVVGWLVCTKGEYRGASFNLKSGRNNIGRALTMDVALAQEKSVSRERHASVTFEPYQKKFFVQSGEGNGLTYVNKELLMTFKELQPYDIISLGACELMFVPLCGETFDWED